VKLALRPNLPNADVAFEMIVCRVYETFHRVSGVRPQYRVSHVHYPEEHRDRDSAGTQEYRHQHAGVPALLAISRGGHVASDTFGSPTNRVSFSHWEAAFTAGESKRATHRHEGTSECPIFHGQSSCQRWPWSRRTRVSPTRRDGRVIFLRNWNFEGTALSVSRIRARAPTYYAACCVIQPSFLLSFERIYLFQFEYKKYM